MVLIIVFASEPMNELPRGHEVMRQVGVLFVWIAGRECNRVLPKNVSNGLKFTVKLAEPVLFEDRMIGVCKFLFAHSKNGNAVRVSELHLRVIRL